MRRALLRDHPETLLPRREHLPVPPSLVERRTCCKGRKRKEGTSKLDTQNVTASWYEPRCNLVWARAGFRSHFVQYNYLMNSPALQQSAGIFILKSLNEGLSKIVLEAFDPI